jgi:hypothetical protein
MAANVDELSPRESLARRAILCPSWRWLSGMRVIYSTERDVGDRFITMDDEYVYLVADDLGINRPTEIVAVKKRLDKFHRDCLPDLEDPATFGCLAHMLGCAQNTEDLVKILEAAR